MLQELLEAEMEASIGYPKNQKAEALTTNKRNGYSPKTVKIQYGEIPLEIPRDRNGEFEPQIVPKHQRDISGIEEGWSDILQRGFFTVFLLIGLAVCVIIAPIFAYEYQTGADAVMHSTRFGRKRVVHAKILAGFLISSGIFFFATAFFMIITFAAYGIQGWNASFRILSLTSFYNLIILQVFLRGLLLNYLVVMAVCQLPCCCPRSARHHLAP